MPFVHVYLKEGRSADQKEKMAKTIIQEMDDQKFAKKDAVRVFYHDLKDEDFHRNNE